MVPIIFPMIFPIIFPIYIYIIVILGVGRFVAEPKNLFEPVFRENLLSKGYTKTATFEKRGHFSKKKSELDSHGFFITGGQSRKNKKWPKPKKHEVANAENTEGPHDEGRPSAAATMW